MVICTQRSILLFLVVIIFREYSISILNSITALASLLALIDFSVVVLIHGPWYAIDSA